MTKLRMLLVATTVATSPLCVGVADAETAAPPKSSSDSAPIEQDIIVTATRVETSLQKTPVALTALSADTLQQRNIVNLTDVGNFVPSLSVGGRGGTGTNQGSVAIRGMGADAPDSAPAVGIYIDEVYYPSASGNLLGLFDVARIEVLRGPQGTLFGRNTIAGAIQYVSVKPQVGRFSGYAQSSVGTLGSYNFSGAVNIPIGDTLAARVSGQVDRQGGYVKDLLQGIERGRDDNRQGRIQLRWTPTNRLTVDLKAETIKSTNNGRPVVNSGFNPNATVYQIASGAPPFNNSPPGIPAPFRETRPFLPSYITPAGSYVSAGFNTPDYLKLRYSVGNAIVVYDLTDAIKFKSISSYSFTRDRSVNDFDASPLTILASDHGTVDTKLFTQEAQLTATGIGNRLHGTAGLYYYDSSAKTTGYVSPIANTPTPVAPDTKIDTKSISAYGQATFDIVGGFSATGGLRYSREDVSAIYIDGLFPTTKRRFKDTSPYIGLNWQANDDTLFYAKASKGFRAGGYHLDVGLDNGALYFGPETAWTYEAGARLSFFDHRLRINPTVYWTDWKDIQFTFIALRPGPIAATQNAGNARERGVELESQFAVTRSFQLTGAFSYIDAKYTSLAPPQPGSVPTQISLSDPLSRTPEFKYSIGGRYTVNFAGGTIVTSADYAWTDHQRSTVDGNQALTLPAYGLMNARIQITPPGGHLIVAFYGTNLTNKYYLLDGINFQSSIGNAPITLGRPREFGASAKVLF